MDGRWERKPDVVTTDLDDELVLLDPSTGSLHTMNDTGRVVWNAIAHPATVESVVESITATFDVDEATATADVCRVLAELAAVDLAREQPSS